MSGLFGTDGIRGVVNREPLTPETLTRIGRALGETLLRSGAPKRVLMARDTRISGAMVGGAILSGLLSAGVDVTTAAVLPTPAVARLAKGRRFGLGVVISASHNPASDNGVKIFLGNARKADPAFEKEIEDRVANGVAAPAAAGETGAHRAWADAGEAYVKSLISEFEDLSLSGLTVALDCANGATCETAPRALEKLGAEVVALNTSPNGTNINRRSGALHPRVAARAVVRLGAHLGVSFDGDGDRALFADERGGILDGDATMAILARDLLFRRKLPHRTVVATVMSNVGLERSLSAAGVSLLRTDVGDRNVVDAMDGGGYALGGEQSGHLVVRRGRRLVGDGLETALHLIRALRRAGGPLSSLAGCYARSPQHMENVRVRKKPDLETLPRVADAVRDVEDELGDAGRVLLRYSGTEPLARVMVEGSDRARTRKAALKIAAAVRREIGEA